MELLPNDRLAPAAEPFLFDEEIPQLTNEEEESLITSEVNLLGDDLNLLDLQEGTKTPTNNHVDLVTSSDWMMSFESPQKLQPSLLDCKVTDPRDVVKYSDRDIQNIKEEITKAHDLEIELAQAEINDLEKRLGDRDFEIKRMKDTMSEWEKAVKEMLTEREKEKIAVQTEKNTLNASIETLRKEIKDLGLKEYELSVKWKQLRLDNTDLEEANTKQKTEITTLSQKLLKSQQQFETLKTHAQEKLEEYPLPNSRANQEISRVHGSFENENLSLKSKCSRLETQNKNLTKALEGKTTENEELMKICDELEKQLSA